MTIFNPPKFLTRSLMGAVGLSAIAVSITAPAAHAGKLRAGFDFWKTPDGGGTVEIPEIMIQGGFITMDEMSSLPFTIPAGVYVLDGHPTGTMGLEQQQETVICFDQHGNAVSGDSEHVVQCLPEPNVPDPDPLEWTDTIVERLEDSAQLSEVGDMDIIPIRMKSVSLVSQDVIPVPFDDDGTVITKDYVIKATAADEQLTGNLKLTVTEVEQMGNMTFIRGIPSIGDPNDPNNVCVQNIESFDPDSPNFVPDCLGLPVSFDLAFKNVADPNDVSQTFFSGMIPLEDGTVDPSRVFFEFKKTTPEPSTALGLLFLGLGSVVSLKRKDKAKK
ncbi:MAG: PEP-CTERM sorting domain-containing protein [Crocosphaera sp.]|nr:PEP-CTERM sorting domain-containing protein [Crocosphaera sp.]